MEINVLNFIASFFIILILDLIWIGFIAKGIYKRYIGKFMPKKILSDQWVSTLLVYLLLTFGILFFVMPLSLIINLRSEEPHV